MDAIADGRLDLRAVAGQADRWPAPSGIRKLMERLNAEDLAECKADAFPDRTDTRWRTFATVPFPLGAGNRQFLVLAPPGCSDMHGVHAVAYWIVEADAGRRLRVLHSGADDAIRTESGSYRGYRNLRTYYAATKCRYRFDGVRYQQLPATNRFRCL